MTNDECDFVSRIIGCEEGFSSDQLQTAVAAYSAILENRVIRKHDDLLTTLCRYIKHDLQKPELAETIWEKFRRGT